MNKENKNIIINILYGVALITALFFDYISKVISQNNLMGNADKTIISNVLSLHYLENNGAAFGILQNQRIFFILITLIFVVIFSFIFIKIPSSKKYIPLKIISVLILAGTLGNFFDRLIHGYVIDFIYFNLINFPVFNVADMYITISGFVLIVLFLFYYNDSDFDNIINIKKHKEKDS